MRLPRTPSPERFDDADDVRTDVVRGTPSDGILEYVEEHDVDLAAMGTAGRTGLERFLPGSTTEKLISRAEMPVLSAMAPDQSVDQ